ncbi:hypothetical protein [Pseudoalteromonas sp. TAE56]|uniref:hypothetical protein n=1 Tax=Pseudoalteromonas sp. TAE56 TaxID=1938596 RepID=UPI0003F51428|nr:hypothetical protein [Pseudoalteromonas sp. TAE56]
MDSVKFKEYIYGNLASIFWSIFLLIGGAIFVSYYANIGYMPDFDFKSSITLVSAASITAILTVLLFIVILILPGAFWSGTWADSSSLRSNWEDEKGHKELFKTALWFGVPILYFYGLLAIFVVSWMVAIPYFLIGISLFFLVVYKKSTLIRKPLIAETAKMLFASFTSSILAFFPIFIVFSLSLSSLTTSKGSPAFVGIIVAVFIVFINVLATAKPNKINGLVYYPGLGFAAFFVVFSSFEIFHRVPERVMELYKFGSIEAKKIIMKNEACETLLLLGVLPKVEPKKQCFLNDVKILSRLGKDMYLEVNDIKFTIKNSEILSWSVQEISNKSSNSDAASSAGS